MKIWKLKTIIFVLFVTFIASLQAQQLIIKPVDSNALSISDEKYNASITNDLSTKSYYHQKPVAEKMGEVADLAGTFYSNRTERFQNDHIFLRVAILGDAEPKPLAEFPNMAAAVEQINTLAQTQNIDFVIGVGDIAHKGTEIQYEAATQVLQKLSPPFYPIMGNEEHGSTVERYLHYAQKWNSDVDSARYILEYDQIAFVFASPDHSRDLDDSGARWILEQIQRLAPKPVVLVVHAAQRGVYPENRRKGIRNRLFRKKVISQPNLAVVISGDLHMDMDRVNHSKKIDHVHYLHIPALERTKIPDETNHTPMFRVMTITKDGKVTVDTYAVGDLKPRDEHSYFFTLHLYSLDGEFSGQILPAEVFQFEP